MRFIDHVDPIIATTGSGKALVGPQVPHGMCKLGPDTESLLNGGYDWRDKRINCFSHTHLEGVGGRGARGFIGVMPSNGPEEWSEYRYGSSFTHDREEAKVGYYSVDLLDRDIRVELTATHHCGLHRYTFPQGKDNRVIFDMGHTAAIYNLCQNAEISAIGDRAVQGMGVYPPSANQIGNSAPLYFYAEFSKPFDRVRYLQEGEEEEILPAPGLRLGLNPKNEPLIRKKLVFAEGCARGRRAMAVFDFATSRGETVLVKVGISMISCAQAKANLQEEIPAFDFEAARAACENAWEDTLGLIAVEEEDPKKLRIFYSGLYRALNQPADYTEQGKFYIASDGKDKSRSTDRHFYLDSWAIWDTFRTTNPLEVLLEPQRASDFCQSLVEFYRDSGHLPTCPAPARGICSAMVGINYCSLFADAMAKGCPSFDLETAYEGIKKEIMADGEMAEYAKLGYVPADPAKEEDFCVTKTIEYLYADWCIAQIALALGKRKDADFFLHRSLSYVRMFDPDHRLFRRKDRDGKFLPDFNELACFKHGYCESSPWESTFFVPHDGQGLCNLFGSEEEFCRQLDRVYELDRQNFENETSLHLPFMYVFGGKPWRISDIVSEYLVPTFTDEPDGLYGEDDSGALSAFNVFAQMGIFPLCPGTDEYVLFAPYLKSWKLMNPDGTTFSVICHRRNERDRYIASATLNGKKYTHSYIKHSVIRSGGELILEMTDRPTDYGCAPEDRPYSVSRSAVHPFIPSGKTLWSDPRSDRMVLPEESNDAFHPSCVLRNDRDVCATESVCLFVDGVCADRQQVVLSPLERRRVSFELRLPSGMAHQVQVGETSPMLLEVCKAQVRDYVPFANIDADFYQGNDHVYIDAAGDQGMEHYGILWHPAAVSGDFDALTCVDYKDVSSPYAPCGIMVRNAMEDPNRTSFDGCAIMGVMSTRGFYSYLGGKPGCDVTRSHWAMGAPSLPCYLKIEKRGKRFRGLYSLDGENWTLKSDGVIDHAGDAQYICLFSRSCIHEKKLARFKGGLQIIGR